MSDVKKDLFKPSNWYKLDNAAKVYPPSITDVYTEGFRYSAILKEPVDGGILARALEDIAPRFPTMMVTLKKGVFWYYLESLTHPPVVKKDDRKPMRPIAIDGESQFINVLYSEHRIAAEFFHGITDGTGALAFFLTLLTRYYEIKNNTKISNLNGALDYLAKPRAEEMEDSFHTYAQNKDYAMRKMDWAYIPHLKKSAKGSYFSFTTDADALYAIAKANDTTITIYLMAIIAEIMMKMRGKEGSKKAFHAQIPVNLRKLYKSETLRNFSDYLDITIKDKLNSRADYIKALKDGVSRQMDISYFQGNMNKNHKDESNKILACCPRFLKDVVIRLAKSMFGDNGFSMCLSNLGVINAPEELYGIIDRMEFCIKEPQVKGYKLAMCTFGKKCVMTFTSGFSEPALEIEFAKALAADGLELFVDTMGGDSND